MSWVPAAGGLYEPTSRTAPRPQAAATGFSFGHFEEKQRAAPQSEPSKETKRGGACYDEPVEQLRWWTESGRANATVTSIRNNDIESFWRDAKKDVQARVGELVNASAARLNKEVALGSNLRRSLMDPEPPAFAAASSSYKADFCADHKAVGRRAVVHSPEAMSAFMASKDQAQRNKSVGRGTNLTLAQF